jgi:hypothetical protein
MGIINDCNFCQSCLNNEKDQEENFPHKPNNNIDDNINQPNNTKEESNYNFVKNENHNNKKDNNNNFSKKNYNKKNY